jgi:hypothetical protein
MGNLERIAAEMKAAIDELRAHGANLTPIERVKLASLLSNLERVVAAMALHEKCREVTNDGSLTCSCAECDPP